VSTPTKASPNGGDGGERRVVLERLSDVEEKPVRFFDRPLFQAATFHVLAGRKGAGKGTYLATLVAKSHPWGTRVEKECDLVLV
jgi:hypothetical protein